MATIPVNLSVATEFKSIVDGLVQVYADKTKGTAVLLADAMPILLAALGSYALLGGDVKSPDDIAYLTQQVAKVLIPATVPAAA